MGPNITSKRGGAKPGQRCSNPKIPKLLAELGVQGFGCLEPSKSAPGTLQDAYNRNPTRPTSRSRSYLSLRRRYDHKKKSQPARRSAQRKAARTSASSIKKLKTLQPGVPDAEDDTKSFMPRVWDPPAPTEGSMHYPVGHPSSQPEILQRAKSRSFQAESSIVHDPPLGTPSHITSKTSSPPHAREAQSNRETASDMSIGTVPGGVARHERTHHRTQASPLLHLRDSPTSDGLQHGGGSAAGLPSAAFYANRLMSLHDSAGLAQMQALHDTAALSGAPHNAAHSNLEHTLLQTSSFGIGAPYLYGALVMDSALVPHHPANTKSNLSTFSVLAQALGSSTTSSIS